MLTPNILARGQRAGAACALVKRAIRDGSWGCTHAQHVICEELRAVVRHREHVSREETVEERRPSLGLADCFDSVEETPAENTHSHRAFEQNIYIDRIDRI